MRAEVSHLIENVAELQTHIAELKFCQLQDSVWPTVSTAPQTASVHPDLSCNDSTTGRIVLSHLDVQRELNDMNRRKKNVIVSGLMEDNNYGNEAICEKYLHCKPMVISCTRLGKSNEQHTPDKTRRLPVRLRNEETAANLLQSSRL